MQNKQLPQVQKITRMTNSQPKYLTNLFNISSKFTGTGGSTPTTHRLIPRLLVAGQEKEEAQGKAQENRHLRRQKVRTAH
jgi:hypothetical protein